MSGMERRAERLKTRHAALTALAAAVLLAAVLVALPLAALFAAQSAEIDEGLARVARYRAQAATRNETEARLAEARQRAAAVPGLIQAESTSIAQARLQSDMDTIVRMNGGAVRSAQILAPGRQEGFDVLSIQYQIAVPMGRLRDLAYAIETHTPFFFIDNTDIATTADWQSPDGQIADPTLEVRWVVRAYRWGGRS